VTRFLVFADVHLSDGPPEQREDSYYEDIMAKLRELQGVAHKIGATATLIAGDLFHRKNPRDVSHRMVREYGALLRDFGPVLAVPGNHDYRGSLEALERSPYGVLREWGVIEDLSMYEHGLWFTSGTRSVGITGAAYRPNEPRGMYLAPKLEQEGALHIHVCHGMLMPVTTSKPFEFTNLAEVEATHANITLCGHYHPGWKAQWRGDKLFYMCSAVARLAAHESDMSRKPSFAVLSVEYEEKWKARITEISLKTARPAEAVFAVEAMKKKKSREAELARFEQELTASTFEIASMDIRAAAREFASERNVDAAVLNEVLSLLEEAEA